MTRWPTPVRGLAALATPRVLRSRAVARLAMLGWMASLAIAAAASTALTAAQAATLQVRPGESLAAAIRQAADGDEVQLLPGEHRGQVAVVAGKRITLRGVAGAGGERPVLLADGQAAERKAILVVRGGDVRIQNIEFRGARVPDRNGAGIRFESGRLVVERCAFFDNENGILTSNEPTAELEVRDSEFGLAPANTPLPHLVYVGRIARFTLVGSRVRAGNAGHLVKSRALQSQLLANELVDGPGGHAAYEAEFPNGGLAVLVGNTIGQSGGTTNPIVVSYLAEGEDGLPRQHRLVMSHNTLVNDGPRPGVFVRVRELPPPAKVELHLYNNLFAGLGTVSNVPFSELNNGNLPIPRSFLRDADGFAFGLAPGSWLRGWSVDLPTLPDLPPLRPALQFVPPAGTRPLPPGQRLSAGAIQD